MVYGPVSQQWLSKFVVVVQSTRLHVSAGLNIHWNPEEVGQERNVLDSKCEGKETKRVITCIFHVLYIGCYPNG